MNRREVWVGIDPGWAQGALAAVDLGGGPVGSWRLSKLTLPELAMALAELDRDDGPIRIVGAAIEEVSAMPGQGTVSTFKFGRGFGRLEGIVCALGIPCESVRPTVWQAGLGLPRSADGKAARKKALRELAQKRWPDEGIVAEDADAWVIADWARRCGTWAAL